MEIEAKFALPDVETWRRLQAADSLAGFALSASRVKRVRDTYLDTAERKILAAGYACRWREQSDSILITLKSLNDSQGTIHRREELEVMLPSEQSQIPVGEWPASLARERLTQWIGQSPLTPLFELQQTRIIRNVTQGKRLVAELSLDDVCLTVGDRRQAYCELEVELKPEGNEADLMSLVACLRDEWGLKSEPRSKFERAMAFSQESGDGSQGALPG
jgi:inorganic triphosphatase YgiF